MLHTSRNPDIQPHASARAGIAHRTARKPKPAGHYLRHMQSYSSQEQVSGNLNSAYCQNGRHPLEPQPQRCTTIYVLAMLLGGQTPTRWNVALSTHFFLPPAPPPSSLRSHEMTLPSITTPLPSMNATRESPSQFLKVSQTNGCCGWKLHCATLFLA